MSLSNDTVGRQIGEMLDNILQQVVSNIQNSILDFCAIQLDETANVAYLAQLCVYARYVYDKHLEDEFLFCKTLNTRTTATAIFDKVDRFFEAHDIKWKHAIGVCTDSAPAMLGCRSGFQALAKQKSPDIISTHCTIHHPAIIMKTMPDELNSVLGEVIRLIGEVIKASALNSGLFTEL